MDSNKTDRAEKPAPAGGEDKAEGQASLDHVLHELQIHQIELEMQNRELKEAQCRIEEARDRYADLYDFAPVGYITIDEKGVVTEINLTGTERLGAERAAVIGKPFVQFVSRGHVKAFLDHLLNCRKTLEKLSVELTLMRKDCSYIEVQMVSVPIREESGRVIFRSVITDISDRKKAERERESIQKHLFKAQKMEEMGKLAGGIAHDFNNLMMIIKLDVELAIREAGNASQLDFLKQISEASSLAANLTRQLLIFTSRQTALKAVMCLNEAAEGVIKTVRRFIGENIVIKTELGGFRKINADRGNIEQLILNLIVNARDSMPKGGTIMVKTRDFPEDGDGEKYVRLTVSDEGIGMDSAVLPHIFDPFFSAKAQGAGPGLGLTVASTIAKELGGRIEAVSVPGEGSTFDVYLPAAAEAEQITERGAAGADVKGKGERILVIEDERMLRRSVAIVLQKNGYSVFEASDAKEALLVFEKEGGAFDLVFSDIMLPDRNGIELCEELSVKRPDVKFLFTSGYLDIESHWPALKNKGVELVQKPYEISDLLMIVRKAMHSGKAEGVIQG